MPSRSVAPAAFILVLAASLGACAHTAATEAPGRPPRADQPRPQDAYRLHEISEFPQYTPDEIGRLFLKMASELRSATDLTPAFVARATGLPLSVVNQTGAYSFGMRLPASGWHYNVHVQPVAPQTQSSSVLLIFGNKIPGADMAPVCGMNLEAYRRALATAGYELVEPLRDEIGRLIQLNYRRNDIHLSITERREANAPDSKLKHACVGRVVITSDRD